MKRSFDLIVIGAGSGGLAAAKKAASYGASVAIVEGDLVGGTCVIRGCVPKKLLVCGSSLLESFVSAPSYGFDFDNLKIKSETLLANVRKEVQRLNELHENFLSKANVELFKGWGEFKNSNCIAIRNRINGETLNELDGERILIAVGGKPQRPNIEGASLGWTSDDMFLLKSFPKKIAIVGAGYIACEFACILHGLGVEVNQLVRGDRILRGFDFELSSALTEAMISKGIDLRFGENVSSIKGTPGSLIIKTNTGKEFDSNGLLFATGRKPFLEGLKLEQAGIETLENKIKVDSESKTNISNIFAIGDVTDRINLTPVAIDEGRKFADRSYRKSAQKVNYDFVPYAVFSQPEIASVGITEDKAIQSLGKDKIEVYRSIFRPLSKSLPKTGPKCILKLIVDKNNNKVLGCHMIGDNASEIIQMASISLMLGAKKSDFDNTMALHPTIAEEFVTMR
ncbi:glutathione-disulfide reductase [Prochlorococcus sp. MIT 1011]|uniref:glutathione-disulfide reductase n=1 Tax=Prochlorococcus sp. MIT 1011 TaxID=3082520 RepID=UPI0039B47AE5